MQQYNQRSGRTVAHLMLAGLSLVGTACAEATNGVRLTPDYRAISASGLSRPGHGSAPSRAEPMAISVSAHLASEPAQVIVRTRIEPDASNRELTIHWWNAEGVGGSHSLTLDGDRAPRRYDCAVKNMSAGEYVVTAVLKRSDGSDIRRRTNLMVIGKGDPFER